MSVVTNIIIAFGFDEEEEENIFPAINSIDNWLESHGYGKFARVDHLSGGKKAMESAVFMGAFNHLDISGFRKMVSDAPWVYPGGVSLMILFEQGERFIYESLDSYKSLD